MGIKDAETMLLAGLAGGVLFEAAQDVRQGDGSVAGLSGGADADAVGLALLSAAVVVQPGATHRINRGVDQGAQILTHHIADHVARQR